MKKLLACLLAGFLCCLCLSAGAGGVVVESSCVTVYSDGCKAGEWYSLLVVSGTESSISLSAESLLFADQFPADAQGQLSVSFIHAGLPQCAFFSGGVFADGAPSPKLLGVYTPDGQPAHKAPEQLTEIQEEAFAGVAFSNVVLGDQVISIGKRAFAGCAFLRRIVIPNGSVSIDDTAFEGCPGVTFVCHEGSAAYAYALRHGFAVELPGE